ncbi:hypothetical protein GIB67_005631 [Kingdonia uniflora]|uniref:Uncharacterized protein n=1 Tax=Kingdonia uniflora TaxID=39325 RepID=A0A7J7NHT9_9MAGN|nr:hypothetical protein GIB67_005631 [Kingdonia uniflora]
MELCIKVLGTLLCGASQWDNLGQVAGKTENPADRYSHVRIRYCTMEFIGKIFSVKVNVIETTGPGGAFVSGDLQEMVFKRTRDFDLQRLTCLLFERFSASAIRPEADFVKLELLLVF